MNGTSFSLLKAKRNHHTKGLEDMGHYLMILLRRMRHDFPKYSYGFLYLVLREFDFDSIQALGALKMDLRNNENLLDLPKSLSLTQVKSVLQSLGKRHSSVLDPQVSVFPPNKTLEWPLTEGASEDPQRFLTPPEIVLPSLLPQASEPCRASPEKLRELTPLPHPREQDVEERHPTPTKHDKESFGDSTVFPSAPVSRQHNTSRRVERSLWTSSDESCDDSRDSTPVSCETALSNQAGDAPTAPDTGQPDHSKSPPHALLDSHDLGTLKNLTSSFSSCLSQEGISEPCDVQSRDVTKETSPPKSRPCTTAQERQVSSLEHPNQGQNLSTKKAFDSIPQAAPGNGVPRTYHTPRWLSHQQRRRIVLLEDDQENEKNIIPRLPKVSCPAANTPSFGRSLHTSLADHSRTNAHTKSHTLKGNKACPKGLLPHSHTTHYDTTLAVGPSTLPLIHPYANALDGYLSREEEWLKSEEKHQIQDDKDSPPPFPEMAGFRWNPSSQEYIRYALGSPYVRPRHQFRLTAQVYNALYDYQKISVAWMFELFKTRRGGILADEMGLGKTVQAAVFLHGLFTSELATHGLILAPLTLLSQWKTHLMEWCPHTILSVYHGSRNERRNALEVCFSAKSGCSSVLLTTYETFRSACQELCRVNLLDVPSHNRATSVMLREVEERVEQEETTDQGEDEEWWQHLRQEWQHIKETEKRAWDVVLMDEAHKIKNVANKSAQAVRLIEAHCRILLTGTPVTNSLDELWSLMDCAVPGLLGNHRNFKREFADVIKSAATRAASQELVTHKNRLSYELQQIVSPYFLRRTLAEMMLCKQSGENVAEALPQQGNQVKRRSSLDIPVVDGENPPHLSTGTHRTLPFFPSRPLVTLPTKTDIAVWIRLTAPQHTIYEAFLHSRSVREMLDGPKAIHLTGVNSMQAVNILLKLCRHPALILPRHYPAWWRSEKKTKPWPSATSPVEDPHDLQNKQQEWGQSDHPTSHARYASQEWYQHVFNLTLHTPDDLRLCSGKLAFLYEILPKFHHKAHRCLIFSQSTQMLDIIQAAVMSPLQLHYLRIDGSVPYEVRQKRVEEFQTQLHVFALLMTTKVGGQGLNLTCADRVILVDPDWTPANDNQAVSRIYRLGQTKDVKIYRLLTAGAIEDHAFRLQTFKQGLSKVALECAYQKTYFTHEDMKKIFTLRTDGISETMQILDSVNPEDQQERQRFEQHVKEDITWEAYQMLAQDLLLGFSNYDALYRELSKQQMYSKAAVIAPEEALQNALTRLCYD